MHTNWQLEMTRRMFLFSFFIVFPFARTIHSQLQLGNNHKYNQFLFFILFLISIFSNEHSDCFYVVSLEFTQCGLECYQAPGVKLPLC